MLDVNEVRKALSDLSRCTQWSGDQLGQDLNEKTIVMNTMLPRQLGDPQFLADYGAKFPYVGGAMANGIASVELTSQLANAGFIGIFGSAGLTLDRVELAIADLQRLAPGKPWGVNLIHNPHEPQWEDGLVQLCLNYHVRMIEASAFLKLTKPVIRYRLHGIYRDNEGRVVAPNRILAKVSRLEVAEGFMAPPPKKLLLELLNSGAISQDEMEMAEEIPVAQEITGEADSGGHTDNRPTLTLIPSLMALREELMARYQYKFPLRIGVAGGIGTPAAAAGAFAMGADYIMAGTIHQACMESGCSETVREMLARARQADVAMAPSADMFEMGAKVQVLKRGTMFPMRAQKLYALYQAHESIDCLPAEEIENLERNFFRASIAETWKETQRFFADRDPRQLEKASKSPKYKMALIFRAYLGQASHWANAGDESRKVDFQIWCGPAIGAFNEWVKGSFLEQVENRRVVTVALNILIGAAYVLRSNMLRSQGVNLPLELRQFRPCELTKLMAMLG